MQTEEVVLYLQQHSDFFVHHTELLEKLSVPHPTGDGQVISLIERQLLAQREKLEQVQNKLAELVTFGEENDAISAKVHHLAITYLMMNSFDATVEALYSLMQESFNVPYIVLRIWGNGRESLAPEQIEVSTFVREFAQGQIHPYCGVLQQDEIRSWFGESASRINSIALIVLRCDANAFGMLVLGSEDRERFYPEMGTLYVEQIGDLTSTALLRYLD